MPVTPRLLDRYRKDIIPAMKQKFGYKNDLQVPRVKKITINMGVGIGAQDPKIVEDAQKELAIITGQWPMVTRAKKDISNFKIRKGSTIGCCVTLRRAHMYEFLDRLINVALARIKDFRGVSPKSFDTHANYSLGLREHTIFPELDIDKINKVKGMSVTIGISRTSVREATELLRLFGMPFAQR